MSFLEEKARRREALLRLVDAGVSVRAAAESLGVSASSAYAILRAAGQPKSRIMEAWRAQVIAVFDASGSVNRAASQTRVSYAAARRILVDSGRVSAAPRPVGKAEARVRFLELVGQGWSTMRAAREVGVNERTARDWRGGVRRSNNTRTYPNGVVVDSRRGSRYPTVMTPQEPARISERYLSLQDRLAIADGLIVKQAITEIAERIGKHKSTVSREVRAHWVDGVYLPHRAHHAAAEARARPKASKLVVHTALREQVEHGLSRRLSPEQISNRLRKDFAEDESMRVSHETIYQALYFQTRGGLKRELQQALRTGRTRRKPQRQPGQRTRRFVDEMVMISDRPADIEDRAVPGHWEGDLITGEANRSAIATLVERSTRYTMLVHLPNGHDCESVRDGLITTISTLPAHLRGSLTWDQGAEMAQHKQFTMAADMAVYFCDPASPWQLPGAGGVAEVDRHISRHRDQVVGAHFRALIPGQRPA
jgi:IS30 family transposase